MNCDEVAESISALFDGRPLPGTTIEHISSCEACRVRLNDYAELNAELRRFGSAVTLAEIPQPQWKSSKPAPARWFAAWRHTMRIPRFAFAAMLVVILALAGSLAVVKARPQNGTQTFLVNFRVLPNQKTVHCALPAGSNSSHDGCTVLSENLAAAKSRGRVWYAVALRVVATSDEGVELGVKNKQVQAREVLDSHGEPTWNYTLDPAEMKGVPEETYWVTPKEKRDITLAGGDTMEVSGTLVDHMPALPFLPNNSLDPEPGELRIVSPVLVEGNRMVVNLVGASSFSLPGAQLYVPGIGRFVLSSVPFEGAIEADAFVNQLSFQLADRSFLLLTGAPMTRSGRVWVLLQSHWRMPGQRPRDDRPFLGGGTASQLLAH